MEILTSVAACVSTKDSCGNFWGVCETRKFVRPDRAEKDAPAKDKKWRSTRTGAGEEGLGSTVGLRGCGCGYAVNTDANRRKNVRNNFDLRL